MLVALILSFPPPVVHIKQTMSKALRSNSFLLQLKFLTANLVHYLPLNSGCPIPLELFGSCWERFLTFLNMASWTQGFHKGEKYIAKTMIFPESEPNISSS